MIRNVIFPARGIDFCARVDVSWNRMLIFIYRDRSVLGILSDHKSNEKNLLTYKFDISRRLTRSLHCLSLSIRRNVSFIIYLVSIILLEIPSLSISNETREAERVLVDPEEEANYFGR